MHTSYSKFVIYHAIYLDLLHRSIDIHQLHCSHLCLGCFGMFRAKWRGWQEMIGGKKSIAVQWMDGSRPLDILDVVRKVKLWHSWHQIIEDDEINLPNFVFLLAHEQLTSKIVEWHKVQKLSTNLAEFLTFWRGEQSITRFTSTSASLTQKQRLFFHFSLSFFES